MPRRPGDPAAILRALSPVQAAALEEALEDIGLASRWIEAPTIARYFELVAWVQRRRHLREQHGLGVRQAEQVAADELGLNLGSIRSLYRDQRRCALGGRGRAAPCPGR